MKTSNRWLIALSAMLLLAACRPNEAYFSYQPVDAAGWSKDSLLRFNVAINDTAARYDIFLHVRHFGNYPYQNFWLFVENTDPRGNTRNDTIECYLADKFGKWLGTGYAVKELPIRYRRQIHLPDSGTYQLKIRHGMRDDVLTGIKEIGVRVEKDSAQSERGE